MQDSGVVLFEIMKSDATSQLADQSASRCFFAIPRTWSSLTREHCVISRGVIVNPIILAGWAVCLGFAWRRRFDGCASNVTSNSRSGWSSLTWLQTMSRTGSRMWHQSELTMFFGCFYTVYINFFVIKIPVTKESRAERLWCCFCLSFSNVKRRIQ